MRGQIFHDYHLDTELRGCQGGASVRGNPVGAGLRLRGLVATGFGVGVAMSQIGPKAALTNLSEWAELLTSFLGVLALILIVGGLAWTLWPKAGKTKSNSILFVPLHLGRPSYIDIAKLTIIGVLVVGSFIAVWLAWLRTTQSENIKERAYISISSITTGYKPAIERWPDFLVVNANLAFNIFYSNTGRNPAHNITSYGKSFIGQDSTPVTEKNIVADFYTAIPSDIRASDGFGDILVNEPKFSTGFGPKLSPEDIDNLVSGRKIAYVIGAIQFQDDFGKHTRQVCSYVQAPLSPNGHVIFHNCRIHNSEIDGWSLRSEQ